MISFFDAFRNISIESIFLRMFLAVLCGSIIGIEREFKRRPAGFRTHILICMGAATTTMTSEYLFVTMNYTTDIARLGAQVIAGIGFIGAGTIIVTKHQRVKGLTTAAGLWAVAIVGLAIGMGFYEGALISTVLIFCAERIFAKLEYWIIRRSPEVNIMLEYTDKQCLDDLLLWFRSKNVKIIHLEITRQPSSDKHSAIAIFSLRLHKKCSVDQISTHISSMDGVLSAEEL